LTTVDHGFETDGEIAMETRQHPGMIAVITLVFPFLCIIPSYAGANPTGNSGLFEPYITFPTGGWPEAVAIGDVNSDGRTDVVMTTAFSNAAVHVFLQNASGGLDPPTDPLSC
jgi:hypothetical protein